MLTDNASALGAAGEMAAAQAFRAWSNISGIQFRSTGESADITFKQGGGKSFATPLKISRGI